MCSSFNTHVVCFIALFAFVASSSAWTGNWNNGFQGDKRAHTSEDVLEALLSTGEEKCVGKRCVHSDQCCPGSVCVDIDGMANQVAVRDLAVAGTCLPIYGVSEGERCESDADCESDLHCMDNPSATSPQRLRTCQPLALNMRKKQYNDECSSSSECDANHGLCCQVIRRHRTAPRKICYYFSDPKSCIGSVDGSRAKPFTHSAIGGNGLFKARIG